ncbi:unnamed protein product [Rangifer tarandus platyrhynchus]
MHPRRPCPETLGPLLSITSTRGLPTCQHLLLLLGVLPATGRDQLWAKDQGVGQDNPQTGPGRPVESVTVMEKAVNMSQKTSTI